MTPLFRPSTALAGPVSIGQLRPRQRLALVVVAFLSLAAASVTVRAVAWAALP
jgi:hypothetical protein